MNLNTMTTSERERLAYAEGFTETAKLFARLDDMHHALGVALSDDLSDEHELTERVQELIEERDSAREERDAYFEDYTEMREQRNTARVALKRAIDLLTDHAKTMDTETLAYLREALE